MDVAVDGNELDVLWLFRDRRPEAPRAVKRQVPMESSTSNKEAPSASGLGGVARKTTVGLGVRAVGVVCGLVRAGWVLVRWGVRGLDVYPSACLRLVSSPKWAFSCCWRRASMFAGSLRPAVAASSSTLRRHARMENAGERRECSEKQGLGFRRGLKTCGNEETYRCSSRNHAFWSSTRNSMNFSGTMKAYRLSYKT